MDIYESIPCCDYRQQVRKLTTSTIMYICMCEEWLWLTNTEDIKIKPLRYCLVNKLIRQAVKSNMASKVKMTSCSTLNKTIILIFINTSNIMTAGLSTSCFYRQLTCTFKLHYINLDVIIKLPLIECIN